MPSRSDATSSDVARLAGVSRATVSHILNGRGERFTAATHERVRRAAEELRYRPSPAGRALVRGRSDLVVAVVPHTTFGTNLQDIVDRLSAELATIGLTVLVRLTGPDPSATLDALLDLRPAAVLDLNTLTPEGREVLRASGVVILESATSEINRAIGRLLVAGALERGVRPLVFAALRETRTDVFGPDRYAGMAAEAADRGLPAPVEVTVPLDRDGAVAALRPVLEDAGPVAVGCYNDEVAIAVLAAARALGRTVPGDVTVVGVDHTPIGQLVSPRLTTVHLESAPLLEVAARTLRAALGLPGAPESAARAERPVPRLIAGETT